ncbi:MAG: DNA recombination protein RmuC [Planctomycetes bacterium]|nr:DNA recombination protein RmuC [Planctomycetota bacterium]
MDVLNVVLGVLAGLAGVAAVVLGVSRARVGGDLREERARREAAEVRAARAGELDEQVRSMDLALAAVRQELESVEALHEVELGKVRELNAMSLEKEEELRAKFEEHTTARDKQMAEKFEALSARSLRASGEDFRKWLSEQSASQQKESKAALDKLVSPIGKTLDETREWLAQLGTTVADSIAATTKLSRALREPHVRGRYGEIQLQRVAELAGMSEHCDFTTQDQVRDSEGNALRPDMVVHLPNGCEVVVDAKTNIQAYLESLEAESPEEAEECLERFARHVAEQAKDLSKKSYWSMYDGSPELVVMFVPGDQFVDAAMSRRPDLMEEAAARRVIIASPTTLIGLLRAVAVGWQSNKLREEAEALLSMGQELHDRVCVAMAHLNGLGTNLRQAVDKYNKLAGSMESRLIPTLRKFEEAGVKSGKELTEAVEVTVVPRLLEGAREE